MSASTLIWCAAGSCVGLFIWLFVIQEARGLRAARETRALLRRVKALERGLISGKYRPFDPADIERAFEEPVEEWDL